MEVRSEYKQTEVGLIPEDWAVEVIENLAHITTGGKNTQDRVADGLYPFFVRSQTVERINSYSFDGEAVLTAGDGVGTGKVFHYINGKFDVHQRVYRISNFSNRLNGYFFYLYFSTRFFNRIMQMTAKSSVDSVRMDMIARMPVPVPTTEAEQRAIAAALSDMDALLGAMDRLIAKKRDLKQAAMQQLLTGHTRLPGFHGEWKVMRFGSLIDHVFPKSTLSAGDGLEQGTYPLLVSGGAPKRIEVAQFQDAEALVFSDGGVFAVKHAAGRFSVTDHCYVLTLDLKIADMRWFEAWFSLNAQEMDRLTFKGSGLRNLDKPSLREIEVRTPDRIEQAAIADSLADMNAEISALEARRDKTRALKHAMMQELLTGKTRLVKPEAARA